MTAPNANTSGLEVVAWRRRSQENHPWSLFDSPEDRDFYTSGDREARYRVEPLVTAASAQARIAELEGLVESYRKTADLEARDGDAAEARADRLATSTADIVLALRGFIVSLPDDLCEKSDAFTELTESLERAALQQEG